MDNVFGQVAIAFTGQGLHNIGTPHGKRSSMADYINSQTKHRNLIAVVLNTTKEQEDEMSKYASYRINLDYSEYSNSCATISGGALNSVGIVNLLLGTNILSDLLNRLPSYIYDTASLQEDAKEFYIKNGELAPATVFNISD